MLVSALMGLGRMQSAYAHAIARGYRSTAMAMRRCCCHEGAMLMVFAAAALQAASPAVATAQGSPPATIVVEPVAMAMAAFDSDGDGRTSRAEMEAGVRRSFEAVDTAHAGKLRYLDFAEWALRWLGDRNALPSPFDIDRDGDDAVSLAELQAWFAADFARRDKDHDGYLTRAELLTIRASVGNAQGGRRGKRGGR